MPFAAYDSNGVRTLCGALADSMEYVRKATGRELSEAEGPFPRRRMHRLLHRAHGANCVMLSAAPPLQSASVWFEGVLEGDRRKDVAGGVAN